MLGGINILILKVELSDIENTREAALSEKQSAEEAKELPGEGGWITLGMNR